MRMRIARIVYRAGLPEGLSVLCFRTSFWHRLRHHGVWAALRSWLAYLIQAENLFRGETGEHMAVRIGDSIWEAVPRGVVKVPFANCLRRDATVYEFRVPCCDSARIGEARDWLNQQVGKPYDKILFTNRALAALARLLVIVKGEENMNIPTVDIMGDSAYICYELVARLLMFLGFVVNPATFGPADLWGLAKQGVLDCPTIIEPEN